MDTDGGQDPAGTPPPGAAEPWSAETAWGDAVLDAVFTQSDIGLHVLDTDLRVVRVNAVAAGLQGIPADRLLGMPAVEAYASFAGVHVDEAVLREVLATGRSTTERLVTGHPPGAEHAERVYSASVHRLQDDAGRVLGVVVTNTDVTDREQAHARLRLLHEAHERIGTGLDVERTARELVDVTVPAFADFVVVALTDAVLRGQDPALQARDTVPLLRCTATGGSATGPECPQAGAVLLPGIFGDGEPAAPARPLPPAATSDERATRLVVPLTVRGQIFGAVAFQRRADAEPYGPEDRALADALASRTANCLENALRYTREHIVMTALQSWPPPKEEATQSAVDVAGRHRPGGSGAGSWCDVIPLSSARVALVVGQVESPGPGAVATMSRLRTAVHSLTTLDLDPHELLARLHATTLRLAAEGFAGEGLAAGALAAEGEATARGTPDAPSPDAPHPTAGCTIAVHDPVDGRLDIARAGASLLVVVHPDGTADTRPLGDGPLLGAEGPPFACATLHLPEGSTLCLASGGEEPRTEDLMAALAHPDRDPEAMADDVERLLAPDRVLLLARTRHLPPDELAEWEIPYDLSAVGAARAHVEDRLRRWNHPADPFAVTLVASELVTNALRHGAAPVVLRLIADGPILTCEVSDAGQAAPHLRHAKAVDEGGRGLLICASLADNWGVRYTDTGKTVWAELGGGEH
ncbi:SpoIIE family protein phosphatase [Streptomyces sp. NK15101]|uniref:SpoIIE family protein phosphatase n=1 Tax=Streptomyces sp. NK15101 TaxID=2873261 RepID=UPI001CECAABE|nr:SpoIIE family protein phosphatase [Streptomyces sp. NK15101]